MKKVLSTRVGFWLTRGDTVESEANTFILVRDRSVLLKLTEKRTARFRVLWASPLPSRQAARFVKPRPPPETKPRSCTPRTQGSTALGPRLPSPEEKQLPGLGITPFLLKREGCNGTSVPKLCLPRSYLLICLGRRGLSVTTVSLSAFYMHDASAPTGIRTLLPNSFR